jgi:hypothetical protein
MCTHTRMQAGVGMISSQLGGSSIMSLRWHTALENSVAQHFPTNDVINCMCHSTDNIYRWACGVRIDRSIGEGIQALTSHRAPASDPRNHSTNARASTLDPHPCVYARTHARAHTQVARHRPRPCQRRLLPDGHVLPHPTHCRVRLQRALHSPPRPAGLGYVPEQAPSCPHPCHGEVRGGMGGVREDGLAAQASELACVCVCVSEEGRRGGCCCTAAFITASDSPPGSPDFFTRPTSHNHFRARARAHTHTHPIPQGHQRRPCLRERLPRQPRLRPPPPPGAA